MNKRKASCSASDLSPGSKHKKDEDDKFVVYKSCPPLREIAAAKITISLWCHQKLLIQRDFDHFLDNAGDTNRDPDYSEVFEALEKCYIHRFKSISLSATFVDQDAVRKCLAASIRLIPIPEQLQNMVRNYRNIIERELIDWLYYHQERIFYLLVDSNMVNYIIDAIVWRPDATIDYLATARNMLLKANLKDIQRYRLACMYCLDDEIRNTCFAIVDKNSIGLTFVDNPLEYYWSCYSRNELRKIRIGDATSIEGYMLTRTRVNNWAAIEYFFDRLSCQEQIIKAKYLIRKYGIRFQTALLSKLDNSQLDNVFTECASIIIANYARVPSCNRYALQIWHRYRDFIANDAFNRMIDALLTLLHNPDIEIEEAKVKHIESLLYDIWTSASDQSKSNALNDEEHYILDYFLFNDFQHPNVDRINLIIRMLSDADEASKAYFFDDSEFVRFCRILVKSYDANFLDKFLRTCFPSVDQVALFKKNLMHSREMKLHCKELIKKHNFDSLNAILAANLPDAKCIVDFKRHILKYIYVSELRVDINIYINTDETIDKCLPDARTAVSLKREIVLDDDIVKKLFQDINNGKFSRVKTFIEQFFFPHLDDLQDIKIKLVLIFKNILMNGTFCELRMDRWTGFFVWCLEDDINITKFKNSLPIDNIFTDLLLQSVFVSPYQPTFRSECNFEHLNSFLDWYFESREELKQYKISKVFLSKKITVIETIIERKEMKILSNFLEWCFESDQLLINQFKMNYGHLSVVQYM